MILIVKENIQQYREVKIMKIYLASPFFDDKELENVKKAEEILFSRGFDVFSPRLNEVRTEENTQQSWW